MALTSANTQADEQVRDRMLATLDNLEAMVGGDEVPLTIGFLLNQTRMEIEGASADELYIPSGMADSFAVLEYAAHNQRLQREALVPDAGDKSKKNSDTARIHSAPQGDPPEFNEVLGEANYPYYSGFQDVAGGRDEIQICVDAGIAPPTSDEELFPFLEKCGDYIDSLEEDSSDAILNFPDCGNIDPATRQDNPQAFSAVDRNQAMTNALIAETIKDMSEQGCDQSFLGFNGSLVCLVTDAAYFILKAVDDSQELCNDSITSAEVEATWKGMKTVHQNLKHMHADMDDQTTKLIAVTGKVDDVDDDLGSHDDDIKALLEETKANQETIIELLNTPSGRRADWND